jgi:hypothetical protein
MNDKELKSLFTSLGIILLYFYATVGIVKLFWNTDNDYKFEGRVKFLVLLSILVSIIYIIGAPYIVGLHKVDPYYKAFIGLQLIYVGVGLISNLLIKSKIK